MKIKKWSIILKIVFFVALVGMCFINSQYIEYNLFKKIFYAPILEFMRILNIFMDFRIAYFITFFTGLYLIWPTFSGILFNLRKLSTVWHKLSKISSIKSASEEEQAEKMQRMIDLYKKDGVSFFNFIGLIVCTFLGTSFLSIIFSGAFNNTFFDNSNLLILWFVLNGKDPLFILPSLYIIFAYVIPLIRLTRNYAKTNDFNKANMLFSLLLNFSCSTIFLYLVINNSAFAIFMITIYIIPFIKKGRKDI